jgi:methylenetetrahydrofolate dehydrogenase (NADP+) / methenyltetrahydrofolate cyclohydrolase
MIVDGKAIASEILGDIKMRVGKLSFQPKLIDVVIGSDPVTESYVNIKAKRADEVGIDFEIRKFDENVSEETLLSEILSIQQQPNLCGLIIQLPLPEHLNRQRVINAINPDLDVDVVTSENMGKLLTGQPVYTPATAGSIMKILEHHKVVLAGATVLVIGAGDLVGKPVAFLCIQAGATVTVANKQTKDLASLSKSADVIITGAGQPNLLTGEMVKDGAIVIDGGTAESGGGIVGDVEFESVSSKASLISPVPGGVGPVTVAMLLNNVVISAENK